MKSELIVDVSPNEVSIALLEDSRLVSLQKEARNISYAVGDIYRAKVKNKACVSRDNFEDLVRKIH